MNANNQTVIEHIEELRKRLYFAVVFFVIAVAGAFFLAEPLIHFLQSSETAQSFSLNAFRITDSIKIYFQMIFYIALLLTSPIILYQLWAFISPGLYEKERRVTLSYIPFTFILFVAGIVFSYFILFPYVLNFMIDLSDRLGVQLTIGINEYFSFLFQITLPFGFVFQLPIVLLFFARLGILNPQVMTKNRKYAYFGLFVIAAMITPPDLMSHLIVTVPMFLLYEFSVWVAKIGYRKYLKSEEIRLKEEQEAEQKRQIEEALEQQRRQIEELNQQ
ncbi:MULTISPECIES: twin-arginine translocase subunit TatC [Lysinibacillus]|uniref:twin-arginine translocase subunit TatC n=1 Tax=Lysinibacillus TaxID=400634 RepID=UPI001C8B7672|nr:MULTISPECIES: twin-arginine translocase subunit TatC [Lysinibacillus]MBX8946525.1 twin-arginine translocase subunit TatC [Lysinibacillus sp. K60]WDU79094.1 twin-arginine translocase subunit TatC [Lysinibacillus sp. G01H]WHP41121.1 twin-arginine translocase subunit TatC [Lysinibacillus boronitolerans]